MKVLGLNLKNVTLLKLSRKPDPKDFSQTQYRLKFLSSIDGEVANVTQRIAFATNLKTDKHFNAIYTGSLGKLEKEIAELWPGIKIGNRLE